MKHDQSNLSARGIVIIGTSICLIAIGAAIRDGVLATLGLLGLSIFIFAGLFSFLNLYKLTIDTSFPHRFYACKGTTGTITLINLKKVLDTYQVSLRFQFPPDEQREMYAGWTPAGNQSVIETRLHLPYRGSSLGIHCTLESLFPLGLFVHRKHITLAHTVTVYPRPILPIELELKGSLHDFNPHQGSYFGEGIGEPRGLRSLQPGDSIRSIHWPRSAHSLTRGGSLQIREFDPPGFHPEECQLIFHSYARGGEIMRNDRFERALSLLVGTLNFLRNLQTKISLQADFTGWEKISCTNRSEYLECLALLAQTDRAQGTESHELEQLAKTLNTKEQIIIISEMPPDSWSHIASAFPSAIIIDIRQFQYTRLRMQTGKIRYA